MSAHFVGFGALFEVIQYTNHDRGILDAGKHLDLAVGPLVSAFGRLPYIALHKNNSRYVIQSGNLGGCCSPCAWLPTLPELHFSLLGHLQGVLDLNTQITHSAFKFRVPQQ